jgi:hypothetical protein
VNTLWTSEPFSGRNLVIATRHGKEKVIAPLLSQALGVKCQVPLDLDTDSIGTFTGEVERKSDALTSAREKCLMAMQFSQCDLAIASEGSFGAHPAICFIPANEEIILLKDRMNGIEIIGSELSMDTNFAGTSICNTKQLEEFALNSGFPSHGLIVRKSSQEPMDVFKGITDWKVLHASLCFLMEKYGCAYVETDMRAMFNPTRMNVIERAVQRLIKKIRLQCPQCHCPGFGVVDLTFGLPCACCKTPTRSIVSEIHQCQQCLFTKEIDYPSNKFWEDPCYCDQCNP